MLCLVAQSRMTPCNPMDYSPPDASVHEDSPGKNIGVGCYVLLQRIFPTQGSNPGLPHCRRILYQLSYQGSPWGGLFPPTPTPRSSGQKLSVLAYQPSSMALQTDPHSSPAPTSHKPSSPKTSGFLRRSRNPKQSVELEVSVPAKNSESTVWTRFFWWNSLSGSKRS